MLRASGKELLLGQQLQSPGAIGGVINPSPFGYRVRYRLPVIANLLAWYDASDAATITSSSGLVSAWADKGPNGYTATEATNKPTTGTRTIGSLNVLDFDGTNDKLSSSCPADDNSSTTFVVGLVDTVTASPTIYGASANGGDLLCVNTNAKWQQEAQTLAAGVVMGLVQATAAAFAVCSRYNGTANSLVFTNQPLMGQINNNYAFTAGRTTVIGARAAANFWDGTIGEIIRYSSTLTLLECMAVMQYLTDKWGLTL